MEDGDPLNQMTEYRNKTWGGGKCNGQNQYGKKIPPEGGERRDELGDTLNEKLAEAKAQNHRFRAVIALLGAVLVLLLG